MQTKNIKMIHVLLHILNTLFHSNLALPEYS